MGHYTALMGGMKLTRPAAKHLIVDGLPDWSRLKTLRGIQGHPELDMLIATGRSDMFGRSMSAYHTLDEYAGIFQIHGMDKYWKVKRVVDEGLVEAHLGYCALTREVVLFSSHKDYGQLDLFIGLLRHFTTEYNIFTRYEDNAQGKLQVGALTNRVHRRGEDWAFYDQHLRLLEDY